MDVIIIGDLCQTPHVWDNWVFQRKFDNIDALVINFNDKNMFLMLMTNTMTHAPNISN
jgi:hypothetical protein